METNFEANNQKDSMRISSKPAKDTSDFLEILLTIIDSWKSKDSNYQDVTLTFSIESDSYIPAMIRIKGDGTFADLFNTKYSSEQTKRLLRKLLHLLLCSFADLTIMQRLNGDSYRNARNEECYPAQVCRLVFEQVIFRQLSRDDLFKQFQENEEFDKNIVLRPIDEDIFRDNITQMNNILHADGCFSIQHKRG